MAVNFQNLPSTNTPLNDTNMNKIQSDLKSEVFEGTTRITDCDDATTPGVYQYIGTTANIPSKGGQYGNLLVIKSNYSGALYLTQIALCNYNNKAYPSRLAIRTYTNSWTDWTYIDEMPDELSITANTGTLSSNTSYKNYKIVNINAKFTGVTMSANTTTTLATLPTGAYNTSEEASLCAYTGGKVLLNCWVRASNGQIAINSPSALSNQEVRIVGSYIL